MAARKKKRKLNKKPISHRKDWEIFPSFSYPQKKSEIGHVPEDFIRKVKEAVRLIDFNDKTVFHEEDREFYKSMKQSGFQIALEEISNNSTEHVRFFWYYISIIGKFIYSYVDKGRLNSWFPYNAVIIKPEGSNYTISFDSLLSRGTPKCRMYYSRNMPRLIIDKTEYKISFSEHAIVRIYERICTGSGAGDRFTEQFGTFLSLSNVNKFETCELPDGTKAISAYEECNPDLFSGKIARKILEKDTISSGKYKYILGYSPLGFFDGYAIAITLLTPGMKGTPEFKLLENASIPEEEKRKIKESIQNTTSLEKLMETQDFSAIKWFHENGIPQVIK